MTTLKLEGGEERMEVEEKRGKEEKEEGKREEEKREEEKREEEKEKDREGRASPAQLRHLMGDVLNTLGRPLHPHLKLNIHFFYCSLL